MKLQAEAVSENEALNAVGFAAGDRFGALRQVEEVSVPEETSKSIRQCTSEPGGSGPRLQLYIEPANLLVVAGLYSRPELLCQELGPEADTERGDSR